MENKEPTKEQIKLLIIVLEVENAKLREEITALR